MDLVAKDARLDAGIVVKDRGDPIGVAGEDAETGQLGVV